MAPTLPKSNPSLPSLVSKSPRAELSFTIQLLSGRAVVMVECPGYDTELFIPQIVKDRITLQNIMLNRRCCSESSLTTYPTVPPVSSGPPVRAPKRMISSTQPPPVARSTPTSLSVRRIRAANKTVELTPEPARSPAIPTSLSMRRIRAANKTVELTPEPARCQAIPFESEIQDVSLHVNQSYSNSSLESPPPLLPPEVLSITDAMMSVSSTPNFNLNASPPLTSSMRVKPPERTYARRKTNNIGKAKTPPKWSPVQNKKQQLLSATRGPNPSMHIEVRRRNFLEDRHKTIEPYDLQNTISLPVVQKEIIQRQVTAKTKQQFDALKITAFDLLTTSAQGKIAEELVQQFQEACIDRRSSTVPNYIQLSGSSQLQLDHEVKTLLARQKRLDYVHKKPLKWMKRM
ncbi:uncharacterized protein uno [Drosophila pseudoobscura]|uniref:Uncharacterized protein uno n=1 Tax=Drosophila pseudoobscura pseudoobscura TaxID=46245 RepID=A0A6I8V4L6_DROPS|nr:uncharacterized protein LOC6898455 [Drosophila pseudoobscura]